MPEYQFVVSGGQPQPATRAVRSHAMRTALQQRAEAGGRPRNGERSWTRPT